MTRNAVPVHTGRRTRCYKIGATGAELRSGYWVAARLVEPSGSICRTDGAAQYAVESIASRIEVLKIEHVEEGNLRFDHDTFPESVE